MHRLVLRAVGNLVPAAVRHYDGIGLGAHRGQQRRLGHLHGTLVGLSLVAKAAGHAAAAGLDALGLPP